MPAAKKSTTASAPKARRQYPRAEIEVRALLRLVDEPGRAFEARLPTANLSVGGMFVQSTFFLRIGTRLLITLKLPQDDREIAVKAQIVRADNSSRVPAVSRCVSSSTLGQPGRAGHPPPLPGAARVLLAIRPGAPL